jgi:hypothetical protein
MMNGIPMHLRNETVEELQNKVDNLKGNITNRVIQLTEIEVTYSCPEN